MDIEVNDIFFINKNYFKISDFVLNLINKY